MRIVLLGPPASGKGTQGRRLASELGVPHVSSGYLIRTSIREGDPEGLRTMVERGLMVPDRIVEKLLASSLEDGFILDGYPRTAAQAGWLDETGDQMGRPLDRVIEVAVDGDALVARMRGRAGAEKRSDDRLDVFLRRLDDYERQAPSIRQHYGERLIPVDGEGSQDQVYERLRSALGLSARTDGKNG